ncbi:MAG: hypothetical protein OXG53_20150 [Chloroflexi bacterium]|nr:hypothetical protein [Chloroflexota bacterium]
MPISVKWNDRSKALIESQFQDPWTLEQFIDARKAWYRMIKSVDHSVPILLDLRESQTAPNGMLRQFSAIHRSPHPRQGHIYILGWNAIYQKLSQHLFDGVVDPGKSVILVDSIERIFNPE